MVLTVIIFILVLGVLVLVHELGHFTAAKLMKIRVDEFGFGLPPRAIGKKIGETIYSLNWLPIGGFVRLYGEDESSPGKVKKDRNRAFFAKAPWQRSIVLVAGVVMNFILGWVIISFLLTQGIMMPGDVVHVEKISPNSPAEEAGIMEGDVIVSVQTEKGEKVQVSQSQDLIDITNNHLGEKLVILLERNGEEVEVTLVPRIEVPEGEGPIGVVITNLYEVKYPWYRAPIEGFKQSVEIMTTIIVGFATLIWNVVSRQGVQVDVAGPVGIGKLVGEAREFGVNAVLNLTAILSFNLALINILPFPALDGGRLVFVTIEAITGKRVKPKWEQYAHQIGMVLLLLLLFLITINDIIRIVREQFT